MFPLCEIFFFFLVSFITLVLSYFGFYYSALGQLGCFYDSGANWCCWYFRLRSPHLKPGSHPVEAGVMASLPPTPPGLFVFLSAFILPLPLQVPGPSLSSSFSFHRLACRMLLVSWAGSLMSDPLSLFPQ